MRRRSCDFQGLDDGRTPTPVRVSARQLPSSRSRSVSMSHRARDLWTHSVQRARSAAWYYQKKTVQSDNWANHISLTRARSIQAGHCSCTHAVLPKKMSSRCDDRPGHMKIHGGAIYRLRSTDYRARCMPPKTEVPPGFSPFWEYQALLTTQVGRMLPKRRKADGLVDFWYTEYRGCRRPEASSTA